MRVLQVINSLGTGGAEKLLLIILPKYLEKGIHMELLLLNGQKHPFLEDLQSNVNIKIHILGNNSVYNPLHVFKIFKWLRKFDLIHVHLFPSLYWVGIAKMISFSKTHLLYTEHNTTNKRRGNLFFKLLDQWIYNKYSKIIAISEEVAHALSKNITTIKSRLVVIPNGIDLQKFMTATAADRNEFAIPSSDKIIIQVSSFTNQKDQITVIKALKYLEKNAHILFVGEGPTLSLCKQRTDELNVSERVHYLGLRMDVANLLKMSDLVLLSSHFEGLSLSSLEAMASGKPFVASRVPGLTSLVEGAGVLFEHQDHLDLAEKINQLLEDPQHYNQVAEACLERSKKYSLDKMVDAHIELYKELCQNPN